MDKEKVITTTLELLKTKKLEKTSIGEILKIVGVSSGNLYYHFKSKNDIYKEVLNYSFEEIIKTLSAVDLKRDTQNSLFNLSKNLIKFLEEREEILFFLMNIRGSSYLDDYIDISKFLLRIKNLYRKEITEFDTEKDFILKIRMFLGSIYEILYINKLRNKKLTEKEIEKIFDIYWKIEKNN